MPLLPPYHDNPRNYYDILKTLTPEQLRQEWREITADEWDYYLGVVPPKAYNGHSFYVGECATYGTHGPIHDLCARVTLQGKERYFMRPAFLVLRARENFENEIYNQFKF